MNKKFYIVGIIFISLALMFFYLRESKTNQETPILTKEEQEELADFVDYLHKEGGFFSSVSEEMIKGGHRYQTAGIIYSMDDIRIHVIVPDKQVITDKLQEEIDNIYQEMASKHNLKWKAFDIRVIHSDETK